MKHEWVKPKDLGYLVDFPIGNLYSCRKCGKMQSTKNIDADNCRGLVRVTLR